jgi:hypothetical protein
MIIGINGYIGSGKDTVALAIQYLMHGRELGFNCPDSEGFPIWLKKNYPLSENKWQIKKFAYKLKLMVSLLTGIQVEDLEKQEVKSRELGPEWWTFRNPTGKHGGSEESFIVPYHPDAVPILGEGYIIKTTVRDLLQKLGTDAVRDHVHPNAWVNALMSEYKGKVSARTVLVDFSKEGDDIVQEATPFIEGEFPNWIISDCRFPNEGQAIKDRGGVIWRINRPQNELPIDTLTGKKLMDYPRHSSETSLDNWPFDRVIENDGSLEDLLSKVKVALQEGGFL